MGTGKTLSTLWMIRLLGLYNCYCALIVAPGSVLKNWKNDQQSLFPFPPTVSGYLDARQAFEHSRVFIVDHKLSFWELVELMGAGKIIVMSHARLAQILIVSETV